MELQPRSTPPDPSEEETKMKRLTLEEILEGRVQQSWLNEPIDYSIDFAVEAVEVKETASKPKLRLVVNNDRKEPAL
jgi:hypothetical protein